MFMKNRLIHATLMSSHDIYHETKDIVRTPKPYPYVLTTAHTLKLVV